MIGEYGPSRYKPEFCHTVRRLRAIGATEPEVAEYLQVPVVTLLAWQSEHEEFAAAMEMDWAVATKRIETHLYQLATGYNCTEDKVVVEGGMARVIPLRKHIPPSLAAIKYMLEGRVTGDGVPPALMERARAEFFEDLQRSLAGTALRPKIEQHGS